jgi:hypothetical protein
MASISGIFRAGDPRIWRTCRGQVPGFAEGAKLENGGRGSRWHPNPKNGITGEDPYISVTSLHHNS